jgi:emp24/gp25L/p24 family/GOLD
LRRTKITEEGDYQICFDNTFSIFSVKTVFFEVSTESEDSADEDVWEDNDKAFYEGLRAEEIYDIQVQDIKDSVAKVRGQLTQAQQYQDQLRAFEARDRNVAESNFSMVNFWSMVHIGTLIITGIIQVVMVRSLFDEKSVIRKLWKQGKM